MSNLLGNTPLERAMHDNLERSARRRSTTPTAALRPKIQATLRDEDIDAAYRRVGLPLQQGVALCDEIVPLGQRKSAPMMGSTDVGDVSWVVPTVQARGATYAIGTPGHSWQLTAQGKMPAAHKGLVHVAKVMAGTAVDVIQDEVLLGRRRRRSIAPSGRENPFVNPIADDLAPPARHGGSLERVDFSPLSHIVVLRLSRSSEQAQRPRIMLRGPQRARHSYVRENRRTSSPCADRVRNPSQIFPIVPTGAMTCR